MNGDGGRLQRLGGLNIRVVEEGTPARVRHEDDSLKGGRGDDDIAAVLRVEQCLVDGGYLIVAVVVVLQLELDVLLVEILLEEAREIGYGCLLGKTAYVKTGDIEFVAQCQCLLFVGARFRDDGAQEYISVPR